MRRLFLSALAVATVGSATLVASNAHAYHWGPYPPPNRPPGVYPPRPPGVYPPRYQYCSNIYVPPRWVYSGRGYYYRTGGYWTYVCRTGWRGW